MVSFLIFWYNKAMIVKHILKELEVLYLCKKDYDDEKVKNIINLFFKFLHITTNEKEANRIIKSSAISLVLVDIGYKKHGGIGFIKNLRKSGVSMPIIVITENKELNDLLEAIKLNLSAYLLKPLDTNLFINTLNEVSKLIVEKKEIIFIKNGSIKYNHLENKIHKKDTIYKLTKNEARLLELFLDNKNKIIQKQDIKKLIWKNKTISESGFKSLVKRLSNKLGSSVIENVFGIGYILKD